MNNKASIANLLNDCNTTTSPCDIQNQKNSLNLYNKRNIFPPRFTNIEKRQPLSTTTTTTTTTTTFTTTELMEHPRQSDTTIISGVQIVTNDDPSVLPHHPFNHPPFPNSNWLPPLHPLYTYDPLPRMPVYKKSKKKQSSINSNTKTEVDVGMVNVSIIRPKRNYTKKPLDRLKRPRNGYMIYMNEVYEDVKRNNPDLKFGELSALIGVQWKSMSKSEQMPYHQKHEEEKSAYESAKLAMSRSNLQIVEETIGIERQVKAAELKAAQIRSKKQSSQPKLIHNERHEPDADNRNEQLHQSDAVIQPSMSSCKLLRQDIPITPVSPSFDDQALQRETQRVKFFKHLNEESSPKEPITIITPQSDEKSVHENDYHKIKEVIEIIDDDEEEQIDQLQPSDSSDIEETDVIEDSSTFVDQSPETQEDLTATQVDTSRIWYLPINGTRVSSGLTSPHRKRKIVRVEEPEEVIFVPKRFKKKIEEYLEREREKES